MSRHAPNSPRPTLASLALDLGVARSTISNAYNRPDQLSPELRTRILKRAGELNYPGPHPAARRLNSSNLTTVGVMFSEQFSYPFVDAAAREFMEGLGSIAEEFQLSVLLIPAPVRGPISRNAVDNAVLDALVVYSMPDEDQALTSALGKHVPTVIVDQPRGHSEAAFVGIDDRGGAHTIMKHVLDLGHRDIAVVTYRLGRDGRSALADVHRQQSAIYSNARERLAGYRAAVEEGGLDWPAVRVYERPEHSYADGLSAGREILRGDTRPTAIVAFSDVLAAGLIEAIHETGLQVPGDVSVVGFDDSAVAEDLGLTTIRQPLLEKGHRVGSILVEAWRSGTPPENAELTVDMVVRTSTAPPKQSR